ncbi:PadR family transcriptional regulator [Ruminococcaceae bacterium OttesenSCG-928-I18]|nr:PadR family transcriptional regulator [Ruminococcaceae bacterium OttesenSCG-928-I18]
MDLPENCTCTGKNLDRFIQPIILSILSDEPQTGYMIVKKMADYSTFQGGGPDPTGIYRYLKVMWGKGMLAKEIHPNMDKGETVPYSITPLGRKCLVQWCQTLREYQGIIQDLVQELEDTSGSSGDETQADGST